MEKKRTVQKTETKEAILEAAIRLFERSGILNTKTASIAKEAGVAHGSVFLHYKTRGDLVLAAVDRVAKDLAMKFSSLKECHTVRDFLSAHLEALRDWEDFYRWLIIESPLMEDEIGHRLVLLRSGIAAYFSEAIRRDLKKQGRLGESSFLFNTWMALVHYYLIERALFTEEKRLIPSVGDQLIHQYLRLIEKHKETI